MSAGDDSVPAGPPDVELTAEERAAVRAYLQRSEVRLSTVHRVATALLSGAGLMVLLPAIARDAVVEVLHSLLGGEITTIDVLLTVGTAVSLVLPFTALWMLLSDLTKFYFHGIHVEGAGGESFVPRFTLTGLRLPADELSEASATALARERSDPRTTELLVPANDVARRQIDRRVAAYDGLGVDSLASDQDRAQALFLLAASRDRVLLEEVAKVEHGMARHVLRAQQIVLRYVKALLAMLTTAGAVFASAAVVEGKQDLSPGDEAWLASILVLWTPAIVIAVTAPVRWLHRQLSNEGASQTAVAADPDLTQVEGTTVRLALVTFISAAGALVLCVSSGDLADEGVLAALLAGVVSTSVLVATTVVWGVHRSVATRRNGARRPSRG